MRIDRLDHLVLTVADIDATIAFYTRVLGLRAETFEGRHALHFGSQKINLHQAGREFEPKAARPTPGSGDLCFVARGEREDGTLDAGTLDAGTLDAGTLDAVMAHLEACQVAIEEGPVARSGALGYMRSVYLRDPDRNLVEIAVYEAAAPARTRQ